MCNAFIIRSGKYSPIIPKIVLDKNQPFTYVAYAVLLHIYFPTTT